YPCRVKSRAGMAPVSFPAAARVDPMVKLRIPAAVGAVMATAVALPAMAADIYEPPVIEVPPPQIEYQNETFAGGYIRGDIGYHKSKLRGLESIAIGPGTAGFDFGRLKGSFSTGAGIGYQVNSYFRTDLIADYGWK